MGHSELLRAAPSPGKLPLVGRGLDRVAPNGRPGPPSPSTSVRAAAAVTLIALVAACSPPPPVVAPSVVAPLPRQYTCEQSRQLANEFAAMPAGSMARQAIQDYGQERDELRAVHGLPKPAACS